MKILSLVAGASLLALVAASPAAADTTTKPPNALSFDVGLTVKQAAARGARMPADLTLKTQLSRQDGQRPVETLNTIAFELGSGLSFDPRAQVQCRETAFSPGDAPPVAANCPKASVVGSGTATVDARPIVPQPLKGKVTIINGIEERDKQGNAIAPRPALIVLVTAAGQTSYYIVNFRDQGNGLRVAVATTPPPGTPQAAFTVTGLDVKVRGKGKVARKPFLRAPRTCRPLAFTATYVLNDVPLTAKDDLVCE